VLVPLELGDLHFQEGAVSDTLGRDALEKDGKKAWRKRSSRWRRPPALGRSGAATRRRRRPTDESPHGCYQSRPDDGIMRTDTRRNPMNARETAVAMPSAKELYEMIAEAAYYRAQKRGFTPGLEADDWVQAETEVLERVRNGGQN
jgi:hypothetical protein